MYSFLAQKVDIYIYISSCVHPMAVEKGMNLGIGHVSIAREVDVKRGADHGVLVGLFIS